ncbi:hypothetical protein [Fluviicola taffensis]|uniref:Uncharacterized protein n=1 Tax=Fluviicola taffensis (strain DSM 16823 / NCIMB 13979 / RW262) TaxID=755732 RepID=F2IAV3_FLUTR|nr:hypothetical protein [Fluviicola taffensis]AEA45277.1 hypothetical protein Fluta_3305 [Fluviicola taffensis DSM 16823]
MIKICFIGLIATCLFGCSKFVTYHATYSTISMAKINPQDSLTFEDWISIDTNQIQSNGRLVIVERMQCYSNGKYAYFDNKFIKSSQGIGSDDGSLKHVFLDYSNHVIYFLDDKTAFNCDLVAQVDSSENSSSRIFMQVLKKGNSEARVSFDKEVPKELKGKYVSNSNDYGVIQTISPSQKMNLLDFELCKTMNLDSIYKIAKRECVLNNNTTIDLLFPKLN